MEARGVMPRSNGEAIFKLPEVERKHKQAKNSVVKAKKQKAIVLAKSLHTGGMHYKTLLGFSYKLQHMLVQPI
jgi:hypothetical protein